ncbi:hypothetical protein B0H21DRAFT_322769 [Amylocystis lapponica]|nr:hypothetical protein B0H21DRAFT_322769 [Amylocystis lapponica]
MQRGRGGDRGSWTRHSSLPSTLIPLLYPGPLDQGDSAIGPVQPETSSDREEEHEQERPYASRPIPLFPTAPSTSALTLTPAAFDERRGREARAATQTPESEGEHAAGSTRLVEAPFLPRPAPHLGRNALRSDPAYYAAGSSYAFTYTYPPPPPPPDWGTPAWRLGEAGPSSFSGAAGESGSYASGSRPTSYARQEQPVASSSRLSPGRGSPPEPEYPGRYAPFRGYSTQRAVPVHGEGPGRFERSHVQRLQEVAHREWRGQPSRIPRSPADCAVPEYRSFPPPPPPYAERSPDFPRGNITLPPPVDPHRPPPSSPLHKEEPISPDQSSSLFSGTFGAGGSGLPPQRPAPVGHPPGSPTPGGMPDRMPPSLTDFELFGRHRAATSSSSRPSAGTRGEDDPETEDSTSQEKPRESGSDEGTSSARAKRSPSQSPGPDRFPRKVPRKTEVACDFCRGRKLRCDGRRPTCKNCFTRNNVCVYANAPRRRGPGKNRRGTRKPDAGTTRTSSVELGQQPQFQVYPGYVGPPHIAPPRESQFQNNPRYVGPPHIAPPGEPQPQNDPRFAGPRIPVPEERQAQNDPRFAGPHSPVTEERQAQIIPRFAGLVPGEPQFQINPRFAGPHIPAPGEPQFQNDPGIAGPHIPAPGEPRFDNDAEFVGPHIPAPGEPQFAFPPPAGLEPLLPPRYGFPAHGPVYYEPPGPGGMQQAGGGTDAQSWPEPAATGQQVGEGSGLEEESSPDMMRYLNVPSSSPEPPR